MAVTKSIEIRTELPGPRSREIAERKERVVAAPLSLVHPIFTAEGRGATITDVDGNTFIDLTGGVGCLNVGHSHPRVVEAAQEQLARFSHTDFTIVPYEIYVELAERLIAVSPFSGPAKAAFFNAGTEAVENSIKFARSYTKRTGVIAFEGAFHGRTLLSMTMTSKTHPYKAGLGPFAPEVYRVPFPHAYRGLDVESALKALRRAFVTQVAAESVAAIVMEPILGEGGFVVAPTEFVQGVREICDEHGIVFVVDEVQTGFGRTGKMWGIQHHGVEPDLMTVAKSIAGGLPLSGSHRQGRDHGRTARLRDRRHLRREPGRPGGSHRRAGRLRGRRAGRARRCDRRDDQVPDARLAGALDTRSATCAGLGAMLAIELVTDPQTKEPAADLASAVIDEAFRNGLLLIKSGTDGNCIRVLTPLVITDAELDEALGVWEDALAAAIGA